MNAEQPTDNAIKTAIVNNVQPVFTVREIAVLLGYHPRRGKNTAYSHIQKRVSSWVTDGWLASSTITEANVVIYWQTDRVDADWLPF